MTLEDKLHRREEAYQVANSFVHFEDACNWDSMQETIRQLSPEQRNEWADLWKRAADANAQIEISPAYYSLLDEAHQATWAAVAGGFGGMDMRNAPFNQRIGFLRNVADAQTAFWKNRFPDVFAEFRGTRVEDFQYDEESGHVLNQYSLEPDTEEGRYYYRVADMPERFDIWTHVAGHEPHHSVQLYLVKKRDEGMIFPSPLHEAASIFAATGGNLPPALVCGKDGRPYDRLGHEVARAYEKDLAEDTARYQGSKMEHAMERLFPPHHLPFQGPVNQ